MRQARYLPGKAWQFPALQPREGMLGISPSYPPVERPEYLPEH